jgi:hypothetical protein
MSVAVGPRADPWSLVADTYGENVLSEELRARRRAAAK